MRTVARAAVAYAEAGYLTVIDGIVIPGWFFEPLRDALRGAGRRATTGCPSRSTPRTPAASNGSGALSRISAILSGTSSTSTGRARMSWRRCSQRGWRTGSSWSDQGPPLLTATSRCPGSTTVRGSAPSWIRTSGLLLRRESLYPAELSGRDVGLDCLTEESARPATAPGTS